MISLTMQALGENFRRGTGIATRRGTFVTVKGGTMKKAAKAQPKTATTKKLDLKGVKKVARTISPKLAANHNETLLVR